MTKKLIFNTRSLNTAKHKLPLLPEEKYSYFTSGSQSIIVKCGKKNVLLITSHKVAKSIEIIRTASFNEPLHVSLASPTLVGINIDIAKLINPEDPTNALKEMKQDPKCHHIEILTKNIVYIFPKYKGTLEDLGRLRFKDDSVEKLSETLKSALEKLHSKGITHGDIALRNVFYTGKYPDYHFFLGDFGKVSQNKKAFSHGKTKDVTDLERLLTTVKNTVKDKYTYSNKTLYINQMFPSLSNAIRKRKGLSPFTTAPIEPKTVNSTKKRSLKFH